MIRMDTGVNQPRNENSTPYEAKPGPYIGPIGVLAQSTVSLCWWPPVFWGQLGLAFQMIAILAVTRNIKAQYTDTGRGCFAAMEFYKEMYECDYTSVSSNSETLSLAVADGEINWEMAK